MFETFSWIHVVPLLKGALTTITICLFAIVVGTFIGLIFGILLSGKSKIIAAFARVYVNIIRGIPLLIILFIIYYGIPILVRGTNVSREFASIVGLSIYAGAYISELVRGAIQAIPKGQDEAATALGMSTVKKMKVVILPQAIRLVIPSFVGFVIGLIKDSSLVSVIGFIDLTRAGKIVGNLTVNPLLTFSVVALIYFAMCYPLSKLARYLENRMNIGREKG